VEVLERGDVFFFYRPRVGVRTVDGRSDVQRFFMVLAPDRAERPIFRLFAIGRKQLPEMRPGKAHPEERNWALNIGTTSNAEELRRAFLAPGVSHRHAGAAARRRGQGRR
jgi:hypothetical protein